MKPIAATLCLLVATQLHAADITSETTWSNAVSVAEPITVRQGTLTIAPGTVVTFTGEGNLTLMPDTAIVAVGTRAKPITFAGQQAGAINGYNIAATFEYCRFAGLGGKSKYAIQISVNTQGAVLRNCRMIDVKAVNFSGNGLATVTGCDFHTVRDGIELGTRGSEITGNTLQESFLWFSRADAPVTVRNNIIVDGMIWGLRSETGHTETILVESNYVHNTAIKQNYGLLGITGTVRHNISRGGTWCSQGLGGTITENVFDAYTHAELEKLAAAGQKDMTHEQLLNPVNGARITRNIFRHPSYGAIMGGEAGLTDCLIEFKTFEGTAPLYLNHLANTPPTNLVVRYNVFLRCDPIRDEKGFANSLAYCDQNLWAEPAKERFNNVVMNGKQPGDDGFGGQDVPPLAEPDQRLRAADVVANPDFVFPFSDEEMLARKHTIAECLSLYRAAYRLKAGQPTWGAVER